MPLVAQDISFPPEGFGLPSRTGRAEFLAFRVVCAETRRSKLFGSLISLTAILGLAPLLFVHRLNRPEYTTYLADRSELHLPRSVAAVRPGQAWKHGLIRENSTVAHILERAVRPMVASEEPLVPNTDSIRETIAGFPAGAVNGGLGVPPPPRSGASEIPLRIGGRVKAPEVLYGPPPEYPKSAREAQVQGDIQIDTVVDQTGDVIEMHILNGPSMLAAAALKAVGQWKYEQTCIDGTPYPVEMIVEVSFRLLGSGDEAWGHTIA